MGLWSRYEIFVLVDVEMYSMRRNVCIRVSWSREITGFRRRGWRYSMLLKLYLILGSIWPRMCVVILT